MHHSRYLFLLLPVILLAAACQKEDVPQVKPEPRYYPVELLMGLNSYPSGGELTRALPAGYDVFNPDTIDPGKIGMFMTQQPVIGTEYTYTSLTGTYKWSTVDKKWSSNVSVKYDASDADKCKYYAYGFMPAGGSITAKIKSKNFSGGAVMTLQDVPPVSAQDLCIVTGVLTGAPNEAEPPFTYKDISQVDIKVGEYEYKADTLSNAIYLLLQHIYSKYSLKMKVDSAYNSMRTVKVTDMKLSASAPAINVDVTYAHGSAPTVTMTALSSTATIQSDVLSTETELTTATKDLASFYCADMLEYLELNTTFDVYDKQGNKLRSKCNTTSKIKVQKLEVGKHYTITATIKPTYLYQLSETDLDQPTVEI